MHNIRFPLGLNPRPNWGAHSAPPDPPGPSKREGRMEETVRGVELDGEIWPKILAWHPYDRTTQNLVASN